MKKNNVGFAMIEVLISMGLTSFVLLALLFYQITALKSIESSNFKNIAIQQLINFSEILLINKSHSARNRIFLVWNKDNQHLLPEGEGNYTQTDDHLCTIKLSWFFKRQASLVAHV